MSLLEVLRGAIAPIIPLGSAPASEQQLH